MKVHSYTPMNTRGWNLWSNRWRSQRPWCQNSRVVSSIWKSEACAESDLNKLEPLLHCMSFQVSGIRLNILQHKHSGTITHQKWHIYSTVMWFWVGNWSRGVITSYFIKGSLSLLQSKGKHTRSKILFSRCGMSGQCFCCNASIYLDPSLNVDFCFALIQQWGCLSVTPLRALKGKERKEIE